MVRWLASECTWDISKYELSLACDISASHEETHTMDSSKRLRSNEMFEMMPFDDVFGTTLHADALVNWPHRHKLFALDILASG